MLQLENAKLNENGISSKPSSKSENNENGVKLVAFYSDDGIWGANFPIYDKDDKDDKEKVTHWVNIVFPQNGEDRALVFNETEMMVNFTSHDPRIRIWDTEKRVWIYSNWCEADRIVILECS